MKKFSDIMPRAEKPDGEHLKIEEVLGKDIIVTGFSSSRSKYHKGDFAYISFTLEDRKCFVATSSKVLLEQVAACKEEMPFEAKIIQKDEYYTFA